MPTSSRARAPRQAAVLAAIAGLHAGALMLLVATLAPRQAPQPALPPIRFFLPPPSPPPEIAPRMPAPVEQGMPMQPVPDVYIPDFRQPPVPELPGPSPQAAPGSGPAVPAPDLRPPTLRWQGGRLAALIDACYPSASRRLVETGRVVVRLDIDAAGQVAAWQVVERSGRARLDGAADCVVRRLAFNPGRRDGEPVAATVLLPIVFRLD